MKKKWDKLNNKKNKWDNKNLNNNKIMKNNYNHSKNHNQIYLIVVLWWEMIVIIWIKMYH